MKCNHLEIHKKRNNKQNDPQKLHQFEIEIKINVISGFNAEAEWIHDLCFGRIVIKTISDIYSFYYRSLN